MSFKHCCFEGGSPLLLLKLLASSWSLSSSWSSSPPPEASLLILKLIFTAWRLSSSWSFSPSLEAALHPWSFCLHLSSSLSLSPPEASSSWSFSPPPEASLLLRTTSHPDDFIYIMYTLADIFFTGKCGQSVAMHHIINESVPRICQICCSVYLRYLFLFYEMNV